MTHAQHMAAIRSIICPSCLSYAWSLATQLPSKDATGAWHHPACAIVCPRTTVPPRVVRVTFDDRPWYEK